MSQADQQQRSRAPKIRNPQPSHPEALTREQDELRALRQRLGAAAHALASICDQLMARRSKRQAYDAGCQHNEALVGKTDPDGAKP